MATATGVARSRMLALWKTQCALYNQSFNPQNIRTGNKVLRERLKGPRLAAYYPPRAATTKTVQKIFPEMETFDEEEADRLDSLVVRKASGKSKPKKKRSAAESKKFGKKKPVAAAQPAAASK